MFGVAERGCTGNLSIRFVNSDRLRADSGTKESGTSLRCCVGSCGRGFESSCCSFLQEPP